MYIAYIYGVDTSTIVAQIDSILDLEIQTKINDVSTASFGIYQDDPYCKREYLQKYRRVRINKLIGNTETNMFDGVIRGFDADLSKATVKLESFEHLLDRRIVHVDYNFVTQPINTILTTVLGEINTRYDTHITLDCGITTTTSKEYKKGESVLKILKDLASLGFEFSVKDMVLYFKETIGIDRTSGADFLQYRYDINEPDDRSINSAKMTVDGKELANGVIVKAGNSYAEQDDPASIAEIGLIETSFSNSGDDTASTQSYLDDHIDGLAEYEVETTNNDFFEAGLGDMVSVYIFVGNDIMFFDGSMKIVQKKFVAGDLEKVSFSLSKTKIQSKNFIDQIVEIQERIKAVELA